MEYAIAKGETRIAYEMEGKGSTALLFIHGWLGQSAWWKAQCEYFRDRFTVVRMDLPGHGKSDNFKKGWTSRQYAEAIQAVAECISAERIILVGHSMAGAYALEASLSLPKLQAIVVVDTLKNIDQVMTLEQAEQGLFGVYRHDFKSAVENILPQYLFAKTTPSDVMQRLIQEFLTSDGERAILLLEPLFKMDIVRIAQEVKVPVRAIDSDYTPTDIVNNRKHLKDYDSVSIVGTGHYPMLEQPGEFNRIMDKVLEEFAG